MLYNQKMNALASLRNGKKASRAEAGKYELYGANGVIGFSEEYNLPQNSIIIGRVGANCGSVHFTKRNIWISDNTIGVVPKEDVNPYFLYHILKKARINELSSGSAQPLINQSVLNSLEFKMPSPEVQQSVGDFLLNLDNIIELNKEVITKLESLSNNIFKHWFIDFEFPDEQGQPYKSSGGKMVESELGMIPEGWNVLSIDEITKTIIDHRGKTPKKLNGDWSEEGYPAISAKNIKNNRLVRQEEIRFLSEELYKKWMKDELEYGDLIMTSEAPLGEMYFVNENEKYCLSQRLFAIRVNKNFFNPAVFFYLLNQKKYKELILNRASGTTVTGIRQSELRKVKILTPPLKVQGNIRSFLERVLTDVHNLSNQNIKLEQLRNILLPKLLSGEIELPIKETVEN